MPSPIVDQLPHQPIHPVIVDQTVDPPIPELVEETPCELLLRDGSVVVGVIVVAYGHAQPTMEGRKVHGSLVPSRNLAVSVDIIVDGCKELALPVPTPNNNLLVLRDAKSTFVAWPISLVRFPSQKPIISKGAKGEKRKRVQKGM